MQWKGLVVNVDKTKVCSYYFGRKVVLQKWMLVVFVVSPLVVILMCSSDALILDLSQLF